MRLFMAIALDPAIKSALLAAQEGLRRFGKAIRLVTEDQMHLTIKFLGDVPDGDLTKVTDAVDEIAGRCAPFEFAVRGLGCFPPRGSARVVWVGIDERTGALQACYEASETVWHRIGFGREKRPFSAHLTLGRVKNPAAGAEIRAHVADRKLDAGTQYATGLTLYQSVLSPHGATYHAVTRAGFKPSEFTETQVSEDIKHGES